MTLNERLGIELPILQAPMAGVQGPRLAIAVSNAGGLGALPGASHTPQTLRDALEQIRAGTERPFNINFFCHAAPAPDPAREAAWRKKLTPDYRRFGIDPADIQAAPGRTPFSAAMIPLLETFRPAVVSFHFGLPPADMLASIRRLGCRILASATTVEEARHLEAAGVDAIIAQGLEAGGHRGMFMTEDLDTQAGLFALLPQIVAAVCVPVIAAGGIAAARGVQAAMALGACAAQVGTAFLLCPEADTSTLHRRALKNAAGRPTALTNVFTGRPARGIVNHAIRQWGPISGQVPSFPTATAFSAPLRQAAEEHGSEDYSPLWSGQNASACREIPAAQLTRELAGFVQAMP